MVLLLGLLLLALLTLLVTNAWAQTRWQQQIAHHELSRAKAEDAARSALRWAEAWLMSRPGDLRPLPCTGQCAGQPVLGAGMAPTDIHERGELWWLDHALGDGFDPESGVQLAQRHGSGTAPGRWMIEEILFEAEDARGPGSPATSYYRIVARAAPVPRGAPVVLETILARPWGQPAWSDALPADAVAFCRGLGPGTHCGRMSWRRRQ